MAALAETMRASSRGTDGQTSGRMQEAKQLKNMRALPSLGQVAEFQHGASHFLHASSCSCQAQILELLT